MCPESPCLHYSAFPGGNSSESSEEFPFVSGGMPDVKYADDAFRLLAVVDAIVVYGKASQAPTEFISIPARAGILGKEQESACE
jgi:hypothetical protein